MALIYTAKLLAGFGVDRRSAKCRTCGGGPTRALGGGSYACFDHWEGPLQLWLEFKTRRGT